MNTIANEIGFEVKKKYYTFVIIHFCHPQQHFEFEWTVVKILAIRHTSQEKVKKNLIDYIYNKAGNF